MLLIGLRVGLAIAIAGSIALLVGVDHPYWAAAVAMLVLHQGGSRSSQFVRGIQRLLGTAVGLGVYWLVITWNPEGLWLAALMFVLQFCIELLVVRNYAMAVTFITPLALTIASAAAPAVDPAAVVGERALDTVVAVAVAFAVLALVGRGLSLLFARGQGRRVVVAIDPVLGALAAGEVTTPRAAEDRRHLYYELLELQHVTNQSLVDEPEAVGPYRPMFNALGDLGYSVLGACWHPETFRVRRAAGRASSAVRAIMSHPVQRYRSSDDILAEVDSARASLADWE
ncbi:FUSC family protein [Propionibacteriaceae bacterium Y1923]|uniref:FUSC family protein n=1 Tax=Aestuariimicrobium sp. Y1814 TaxID=3418742 RepID=UPI003C1F1FD5